MAGERVEMGDVVGRRGQLSSEGLPEEPLVMGGQHQQRRDLVIRVANIPGDQSFQLQEGFQFDSYREWFSRRFPGSARPAAAHTVTSQAAAECSMCKSTSFSSICPMNGFNALGQLASIVEHRLEPAAE